MISLTRKAFSLLLLGLFNCSFAANVPDHTQFDHVLHVTDPKKPLRKKQLS